MMNEFYCDNDFCLASAEYSLYDSLPICDRQKCYKDNIDNLILSGCVLKATNG